MSCCRQKPEAPEPTTTAAAPSSIHRQMTIKSILSSFPQKSQRLSQEITKAGLHCVGCQAAVWETLEAGMLGHGMPEESIDQLVDRLNAILQETSDASTVSLTSTAAKKYLEILESDGKAGWGLRLSERMAGCSGFEHTLDYSEKALEDDVIYGSHGIEIHINKHMNDRLQGSLIDYIEDGVRGSGFIVSNPNARSSCGCGTSHNY